MANKVHGRFTVFLKSLEVYIYIYSLSQPHTTYQAYLSKLDLLLILNRR